VVLQQRELELLVREILVELVMIQLVQEKLLVEVVETLVQELMLQVELVELVALAQILVHFMELDLEFLVFLQVVVAVQLD
jgi:hypothetical protein